ncbi:N-acetyl-gamma-glutamyl-phosphate reductase [Sphingomonas solaris]|uniref:N-acetyl-gamma-glutamyl-phosphate reductase n=1 Tax=Alterirhizorhabdus solaris TaxID=2529389 RepID=A0A558QU83_9SPHN|nr:N-acetyl-gamma-glutamyl-phosphate reductase [Sphingomonas solaris]TVV70703.1 N-acetyl-gamma-glutamyl-phosphate reductase [Sphingomonas solaris]
MSVKVFIDGGAGTTGIEIHERLAGRADVDVVVLPDDRRKDAGARAEALNAADAVILCLPDDAAREAVSLIENTTTRVIDASTAHRTDPTWTYGFAEVAPGRRAELATATRVSNPGCYPTGFLALVAPLVRAGIVPADLPLSVNATSGYSGGGKAMIAAFEQPGVADATETGFRIYALSLGHKHVPEMQTHAGLAHPPIFMPAVARSYRGMLVEVPLHAHLLNGDVTAIRDAWADAYRDSPLVRIDAPIDSGAGSILTLEQCAGTDRLDLFAFARDGQIRLVAALDNLGKGAAGAAVQNLNLMTGLGETAGLRL